MIKSTDLRIGNYVRITNDAENCEVLQVEKKGLLVKDFLKQFDWIWIELDAFEPIPLTPEWLERAKDLGNFEFIKDSLVIIGDSIDYNGLWIGKIHYVHTLQNLFYALTGEELEFNLDNLN